MVNNLSAKYSQKINERPQKRLEKDIKIYLKIKKETNRQYSGEQYINLLNLEKQSLVEYTKKLLYNVEKLFTIMFRRTLFFYKNNFIKTLGLKFLQN